MISENKKERDLFSVRRQPFENEKKSKKRKKKNEDEDESYSKKKRTEGGQHKSPIYPLRYETLANGLLLLGCIQEVRNYELVVSLPHRLVGTVPLTRICNAYTEKLRKVADDESAEDDIHTLQELFKPGQFVVTQVHSLEEEIRGQTKSVKVNLTLLPHEINSLVAASHLEVGHVIPCAVASVEDKGYVIDTGILGVRAALLPHKNTRGANIVGVGSLVRCLVTKIKGSVDEGGFRLKLSAIPADVNGATLDLSDTTNLSLLIPGTAVTTSITRVLENGLNVILANFDGVVSSLHLKRPFDMLNQYSEAKQVRARVLYITPLSKVVHLTLLESVCSESGLENDPLHGISIGDKIEEAEIYRSSGAGVFFKLSEKCRGFCAANRLTDHGTPQHISRDYPVGAKRMCRVLKYCYVDQLFITSLQRSTLQQQVLGYSSIHVGDVIKGTIKAYSAHGASLAVSKFVDGHVPLLHLSDTRMKNPEKKHSIGEIVTTRVLKVTPEKKQLVLTCKKHLIKSKHEIITEYKNDNKDKVTEGYIFSILPLGLLISFYNDIKGFAPKRLVTKEPDDNLKDLFYEGMVVRCQIVEISEEDQRMTLSLLIAGDESKEQKQNNLKKKIEELKLRSLVSCTVQDVGETLIKVRIQPAAINAFLPVVNLSDDPNKCKIIKNQLQKGDKIHNAIVFKKYNLSVYLTLKHSVYCWLHDSSPEVLESKDLVKGECYPAVVIKVFPYSLLLVIPVGEIGVKCFLRVRQSTKSKASECTELEYKVGQVMTVMCSDYVDTDPVLLPCNKDTSPGVMQKSSVHLLYGHFRDEEFVQRGWQRHGGSAEQLAQMKVGDSLDGLITAVTPHGMLLKLGKDELTGVLSNQHQGPYSKAKIGDRVSVCVLHVNYQEKCLEVSANSKIVNKLQIRDEPAVKVGQIVKSTVVLSKRKFILVVLETARTIAYIVSKKNTVGCRLGQLDLEAGVQHHVVIKYVAGSLVLGILSDSDQNESIESVSPAPNIIFSKFARNQEETDGKLEVEDHSSEEFALEKIKRVIYDSEYVREKEKREKNDDSVTADSEAQLQKVVVEEEGNMKIEESTPECDTNKIKKEGKNKRKKQKNADKSEEKVDMSEKTVELKEVETNDVQKVKLGNEKRKKQKNTDKSEEKVEMNEKIGKFEEVETNDVQKQMKSGNEERKKQKNADKSKEKEETNETYGKLEEVETTDLQKKMKSGTTPVTPKDCLKVDSAFVWDVPTADGPGMEDSSDSDEEDHQVKRKKMKKLNKAEKELLVKEEEQRLHELELARLDKDRVPETVNDFEELLQRNPNSSALWIQFVSFHLESAEVDKAKALVRRALQMINTREEEERLNIWTVLLRLEVLYGTPESVEEAYREALTTNDQLKIYIAMAMVYAENDKMKEAASVYYSLTKKFGLVLEVWIKAGVFFFSHNKLDEARKYMERALVALDKKDHVELINRFGQLEFRFGDAERGRTIFESLLSNYPKRIDIWSVYVDLLTKKEDIEGARHVLDRMTGLKLRLRKMRFVFKKFLEFEKAHGTPQSIESVKKRVEEFVSATLQQDA